MSLKAVHSEVARTSFTQNNPYSQWVPVPWAVGRKMAFEIEVERRALGYGTQSGNSAQDRLLILFLVVPIQDLDPTAITLMCKRAQSRMQRSNSEMR